MRMKNRAGEPAGMGRQRLDPALHAPVRTRQSSPAVQYLPENLRVRAPPVPIFPRANAAPRMLTT